MAHDMENKLDFHTCRTRDCGKMFAGQNCFFLAPVIFKWICFKNSLPVENVPSAKKQLAVMETQFLRRMKGMKMKIAKMIRNAALICTVLNLLAGINPAPAQTATNRPARPTPSARDPHTPGFVAAKELPDGTVPLADVDGNFIIGPTHKSAPEIIAQTNVLQGAIYNFTMSSADSKIYPGIARESGTFGTVDPADPAKLIVTTSQPAPYTRHIAVYVPKQYVPGTAAPFIVGADGPDKMLFTALDNLIAEKKVPVMIAISIGNGSGDAQGSERGLEYDTMSGRYAEFVEREVLPLVEKKCDVKLIKNPDARAAMGGSSGGSCALIMAWYHPELYHRVLTYSGTYVNQQWPPNPETPGGAWEFHKTIIPNSPAKPLRIWMEVGDRDLLNPNAMRDNMHDWVIANENMAKVLAAKGYHYQFVFARNAGHTDRNVKQQTLPEALEWLWQDYKPVTK
jgi:iron(III)-enterobactin esterase